MYFPYPRVKLGGATMFSNTHKLCVTTCLNMNKEVFSL